MKEGLRDEAVKTASYGSNSDQQPTPKTHPEETTDGKSDNSKGFNVISKTSRVGFIVLGVLHLIVFIIITSLVITYSQLCVHLECILLLFGAPYYFFACLLFLLTAIFCFLVSFKRTYSFLVTELVFSVLSMLACIVPCVLFTIFIKDLSMKSTLANINQPIEKLYFGVLVTSFVELVVAVITCALSSRHIHCWKE